MAVLALKFSERGRNILGVTLLLLNLSIAVMGLILIAIVIVLESLFSQQRDMLQGEFNYKRHVNLIIFAGIALLLFHLFGAKICSDYSNHQTRDRFKRFMMIYMALLFVTFVLLMAVSISALVAVSSLQQGFEKGFLDLMASYDSHTDIRQQIDTMQITHKCCGSTGYKDWLDISWYPEQYMRPNAKSRGVPFTCCDPNHGGPCLHEVGGIENRPGFKKDDGKSFYQEGCSEVSTVTLRWLLKEMSIWLMLPMWLEIITLILTKYLHTSCENAADQGDEQGKGFGYLMEQCPFSCLQFCECDIYQIQRQLQKGNKK